MGFRTDDNNNPTAMTTGVAADGGLVLGTDYEQGASFTVPEANGTLTLYTAKLLGDPITLTIKAIDKAGFYTGNGPGTPGSVQRWEYIAMLHGLWMRLTTAQKTAIIGVMYTMEGGIALKGLFGQ